MFKPKERQIYRYWNGVKEVAADPMRLAQKMLTCYPKESTLEADLKYMAIQKEDVSLEAMCRMADFARAIFRMKALDDDGEGVTDSEAIQTLTDFSLWMEDVKKNMLSMPTSPKPSDQTVSTGAAESQPTVCGAGLPSTGAVSSCDVALPPSQGSPQP